MILTELTNKNRMQHEEDKRQGMFVLKSMSNTYGKHQTEFQVKTSSSTCRH